MPRWLTILGQNFSLPDPDVVEEISRQFRQISDNLEQSGTRLTKLGPTHDWGHWSGSAADAFEQKLGPLPGDLNQASGSFGKVAWALWEYGNTLRDVITSIQTLAGHVDDAQSELSSIQAAAAANTDPTQQRAWQDKITQAQQAVASHATRLQQLRDDLDSAAHLVEGRIQDAINIGITGFSSFGRHWIGRTQNAVGEVAGFVVHPIEDLPGAIAAEWNHPSWQNLARVVGDVAGIVGLVALVIPGLGEALMVVSMGLDAGKLALDTGAVVSGETHSWGNVALDGISLALDGTALHASGAAEGETVANDALGAGQSDLNQAVRANVKAQSSLSRAIASGRSDGLIASLRDGADGSLVHLESMRNKVSMLDDARTAAQTGAGAWRTGFRSSLKFDFGGVGETYQAWRHLQWNTLARRYLGEFTGVDLSGAVHSAGVVRIENLNFAVHQLRAASGGMVGGDDNFSAVLGDPLAGLRALGVKVGAAS
ncbi:MAG TPA: hypothetical protein VNG13_11305 [Mycobacteriales bacterium]|nr:hypothetical protein [Mycobacteriales bacterium]